MKLIRKIFVAVAVATFLLSLNSCATFGGGGCDCPKFGQETPAPEHPEEAPM